MGKLKIMEASAENIPDIQKIAEVAFPHAFESTLSPDQISYMMTMMYSTEALKQQFQNKHRFFLAKMDGQFVGYCSIEHHYMQSSSTKIHKAYILPVVQKHGIGRSFFDVASAQAIEVGDLSISLNVNKYNENAMAFYAKYGMKNVKAEVIEIGKGFVMDDYVFLKKLS